MIYKKNKTVFISKAKMGFSVPLNELCTIRNCVDQVSVYIYLWVS